MLSWEESSSRSREVADPFASADACVAMDLVDVETQLRILVSGVPSPGRAEMLRILTIRDDAQRASAIGDLHQEGVLRESAELLIDCDEDPILRAVLVGMLLEAGYPVRRPSSIIRIDAESRPRGSLS